MRSFALFALLRIPADHFVAFEPFDREEAELADYLEQAEVMLSPFIIWDKQGGGRKTLIGFASNIAEARMVASKAHKPRVYWRYGELPAGMLATWLEGR